MHTKQARAKHIWFVSMSANAIYVLLPLLLSAHRDEGMQKARTGIVYLMFSVCHKSGFAHQTSERGYLSTQSLYTAQLIFASFFH